VTAEDAILAVLAGREGTLCPTEAARMLAGDGWREALPSVHEAARLLAATGTVALTQRGATSLAPRGAYRIGRPLSGRLE
jgi:hypothetical protein